MLYVLKIGLDEECPLCVIAKAAECCVGAHQVRVSAKPRTDLEVSVSPHRPLFKRRALHSAECCVVSGALTRPGPICLATCRSIHQARNCFPASAIAANNKQANIRLQACDNGIGRRSVRLSYADVFANLVQLCCNLKVTRPGGLTLSPHFCRI